MVFAVLKAVLYWARSIRAGRMICSRRTVHCQAFTLYFTIPELSTPRGQHQSSSRSRSSLTTLLAAIIVSVTLYLHLSSVIVVPFLHPPLVASSTNFCVPCLLGLTDDEAFPNELPHFLLDPYCAEIANPSCQSDILLIYGSQTSLPKHVARPERRGAVPAMIRELS